MPIANDIRDLVNSVTQQRNDYDDVITAVREIVAELQQATNVPGLEVRIEAGHAVNMGQQYRFVVAAPGARFNDTFFRFYVPPDGYPTTLSLFEDEYQECADREQLQARIMEFLNREPMKRRLQALISLARQP